MRNYKKRKLNSASEKNIKVKSDINETENRIEKNQEIQSLFFEKINKIEKSSD